MEFKQRLYVDGMIGRGENMATAKTFKENISKVGFKLHRCYSNAEEDHSKKKIEKTYTN